jgi:hypothetical protein
MVRCVIYKHNRDISVINNLFITHTQRHTSDIYAIENLYSTRLNDWILPVGV